MSSNIIPINGESPFDQIKQTRADGSEFWSARDLMDVLGYSTWQRFENPLNRAMTTAQNQGHDTEALFSRSVKRTVGRHRHDFELVRFAAYLTVMNGDPNMTRVAEGQAYFAVKTREAEVAQPIRELTLEEKALEVIGSLRKAVSAQKAENEKQATQIEAARPYVARAVTYQAAAKDQGRREFAREVCKWARDEAHVKVTQDEVHLFLGKKLHIFIASNTKDHGHATAEAEKRGLAVTEKDTTKDGYNWAAGRLTPKGQEYAWKKIVAHVTEYGTLSIKDAA